MTSRRECRGWWLDTLLPAVRLLLVDLERLEARHQRRHDLSGWETLQAMEGRRSRRPPSSPDQATGPDPTA
jgi:hypothetical protein